MCFCDNMEQNLLFSVLFTAFKFGKIESLCFFSFSVLTSRPWQPVPLIADVLFLRRFGKKAEGWAGWSRVTWEMKQRWRVWLVDIAIDVFQVTSVKWTPVTSTCRVGGGLSLLFGWREGCVWSVKTRVAPDLFFFQIWPGPDVVELYVT